MPKDEAAESAQLRQGDLAPNAAKDPEPERAASAGTQRGAIGGSGAAAKISAASQAEAEEQAKAVAKAPTTPRPSVAVKERLFAHPARPASKSAGGARPAARTPRATGFSTFKNYFSRPLGLNPKEFRLKQLRKGSHVIGGTILGRVGRPVAGKGSHL